MKIPSADLYTDFSAFNNLRAQARSGSAAGRQAAAKQVEALFLGMMLKSMRAAGGTMLTGPGAKVREGMFDSQLVLSLAKNSKLGFAELMLREFNGRQAPTQDTAGASNTAHGRFPVGRFANDLWAKAIVPVAAPPSTRPPAIQVPSTQEVNIPGATGAAPAASFFSPPQGPATEPPARWNNADEFAAHLWPAARRAAQALGTQPEAVLAVAALETGWGAHMPSAANGDRSNNLFGIKARGWSGPVIHAQTLEYESGGFVRKLEPFRRYASAQQSFEDFVHFIKNQPRYAAVLDSGGDPVAFVRALQQAGYATDPDYAGKIEALMRGDTIRKAQAIAAAEPGAAVSSG